MKAHVIRFVLSLAAALSGAVSVRAERILQAPSATLTEGQRVRLALVVTAEGAEAVRESVPKALAVSALASTGSASLVFTPEPGSPVELAVAPGGFARVLLSADLPAGMTGIILLDAASSGLGRVAIEVRPASPAAEAASRPAPRTDASEAAARSASSERDATPFDALRPRDMGFSPHEPLYFSVGFNEGANAKFQVSFKYRPIGPSDDRIAGAAFWEDIYFAFTQTSLWDLQSPSAPFRDSSYKPSVFYQRFDTGRLFGGSFGWAAGFEHESNGKDSSNSRSINLAVLRPTLRWGDPEGWRWSLSPKFYAYIEKTDNTDIDRYRGYCDLHLSFGHARSWKIETTSRLGNSGKGFLQVDASYPFARVNDWIPLGLVHGYLHLQYTNGWGESLLDYNRRTPWQFRIGFMALR